MWGQGMEVDPVGATLFAVRLLRTMGQGEPATDFGVGVGVLAFVEEYGDVSAVTLRRMLYELGAVAFYEVSREYVIEMMEAEG